MNSNLNQWRIAKLMAWGVVSAVTTLVIPAALAEANLGPLKNGSSALTPQGDLKIARVRTTTVEVSDQVEQIEPDYVRALEAEYDQAQSHGPRIYLTDAAPDASAPNGSAGDAADAWIARGNAIVELLDKILNLGDKAWKVVEAGAPAATANSDSGNALPADAKSWTQLQGWKPPRSYERRVVAENYFGWTVLDYRYRVIYTYGGSVKGRGQYITHAKIVPSYVWVARGFTFNASAKVENVVNRGTTQRPVAGMELSTNWRLTSVATNMYQSQSYFIQGDGQFKQVGR